MKSNMVSVTEAVRNFSDYIGRVAYRQETFVLCKGKRPVAELRPLPAGRRLGDLPGLFQSLPALSRKDVETLARDVDEVRGALPPMVAEGPWES